jgi:hypothetical protein
MKKFIFLIASAAFFMSACDKTTETETPDAAATIQVGPDQSSTATELPKGVIPSDIGLNAIILHPDKYSWRDLDVFYRDVVLGLSEESYFESLKKATISHMVKQFDMLENADLKTIEFYALEQNKIDWVNADVFFKSVEKLKGAWPDEHLKLFCKQKYEKDKKFITQYFGEARWEKQQVKYEPLVQLEKSLMGRWGY